MKHSKVKSIPRAVRTTSRGDHIHQGSSYSEEEVEFLRAIEAYKSLNGRPHPTWTEVLFVLKQLGYRKKHP